MDNTEAVINSRDVIWRIEELSADRYYKGHDLTTPNEASELRSLRDVAEQGEQFKGWDHGLVMIRETYFTEYIRHSVTDSESLYNLPPFVIIDWEATARGLRTEYQEVNYGGVTYYTKE